MTTYRSTATIDQIAARITRGRRILLTTHVKPDGDGMGATLALRRALVVEGEPDRAADIYLMGPVEASLREVAGDTPYHLVEDGPPGDDYDLVAVLDTGSWSQLEPLAEWLKRRREDVIGLDHHAKGDDVAPMRIVDPRAASTTQVMMPLLEAMGCEITGGPNGVAEALFVGLATDTGWFRFSSADPEALRLAARLLEHGVDKTRLYRITEETFRPQRLALQARALASLEYARNGSVIIMTLRPQDFQATGGCMEDLSQLVNTPMSVRAVQVSILLAQTGPKRTKISFRSKPPLPGADRAEAVDVNLLAQRFGGGGHTHAAGAGVEMDADEARDAVLAVLLEEEGTEGLRDKGTQGKTIDGCRGTRRSREPRST
ncbi:MAG: DHH family phosphoesterase [Planctomycetota bacterium]|jgi:phosphoesterase RecJ-like protein